MHFTLWVLRTFFLLVSIGLAVSLTTGSEGGAKYATTIFFLFTLGPLAVIVADLLFKRKRIDLITSVYFGILIGLLLTYIFNLALTPLFESMATSDVTESGFVDRIKTIVMSFLGISLSYICVSFLWQTKDDFRFIIPYVEFSKDVKGAMPYILDTSVVIDGRIADIVETGIIDNQLILPRFALMELQSIADSSDKLRRSRGRRGLDVLNRLRSNESIDLKIYDRELPEMKGQPVDLKLLTLARHLGGKVVTGDFNLNKVAKLQNVPVINLNEIANSLKPVFLPGEQIRVKVVKAGEGAGQGVGYLEDGTMIVIEEGRDHIGDQVDITVTSMLQTNAGRMVFGKFESAG
ncbi:MAG: TRAM domain-containing protein [Pirellulaceae bacterium]